MLRNVAPSIGVAGLVCLFADLVFAAPKLFFQFGNCVSGNSVFSAIDRRFNFVSVGLSVSCKEVLACVLSDDIDGYLPDLCIQFGACAHAKNVVRSPTAVSQKIAVRGARELHKAMICSLGRLLVGGT